MNSPKYDISPCATAFIISLSSDTHSYTHTHLGQCFLSVRLDSEARDVGIGEAGTVSQLFHATDLGHRPLLLLLILL